MPYIQQQSALCSVTSIRQLSSELVRVNLFSETAAPLLRMMD